MISDLDRFDTTFKECVTAFLKSRGRQPMEPAAFSKLRKQFEARIPTIIRRLIGHGLGTAELRVSRGYFVGPACDGRRASCQYLFNGKEILHPCWELYVQLAEAVRLVPLAQELGLRLKMEARLMDLTLSRGRELLMYVEVKRKAKQAQALLDDIRRWGNDGVAVGSVALMGTNLGVDAPETRR